MNNRKVKTIVILMSGIFLFSSCSTLIDGVREINYMLKYMRLEKKTTTTGWRRRRHASNGRL